MTIASGGMPVSYGISDNILGRLPWPDLTRGLEQLGKAAPRLARQLTDELRHRGYNECNPYDFVGLGPYAPYRRLNVGRIAIPQSGGHTSDYGYDVVVHFHGQTAMRTTLAQVARGVAFVGIDLGNGSGAYSDGFMARESWPNLRESIETALRAHSGKAEAHLRRVALMAWSAGYGAVNEILKYNAAEIDAVVLLDGLHAAWDRRFDGTLAKNRVIAGPIAPTVEFARQALAGDKIFIFTHSEIDPILYPSTAHTAQFLIDEMGLTIAKAPPTDDPFGLRGAVDVMGLHVWSYAGNDKPAHCTHLSHVDHAVRDILEPAWGTPEMDRTVPPTPAPRLGSALATAPSDGEAAHVHAAASTASRRGATG